MGNDKILDCTLRDGGYYTDWVFEDGLVVNYLDAMEMANIDIVELGLRSKRSDKFLGPFFYCSEDFLEKLDLKKKSFTLGVMINASEFIKDNNADLELVSDLFIKSSDSLVDLVRVACHLKEVALISPVVKKLREMGYQIGINLMQAGGKPDEEIRSAVQEISSWNSVDVLYFADSMGNMLPSDVEKIIDVIKLDWNGLLGIHTHDNMGNAVANSLKAKDKGVSWIDGTILGMGRGAGNSRTEYLTLEMNKIEEDKYSPSALFSLVMKDFSSLQKEHRWGSSLLYYLSAMYNIHPTYVQEMANIDFANEKVLAAMEKLKLAGATSFNSEKLMDALAGYHIEGLGSWSPQSFIEGKDLLILGGGRGTSVHHEAIENYIDQKKPITISLNIQNQIPENKITAYAACHPIRLLTESNKYKNLKKPLMTPKGSLDKALQEKIKDLEIFDFGIEVKKGQFEVNDKGCVLPSPLVIGYVLAMAAAGKAKRVLLAGFDGYSRDDNRRLEMDEILKLYRQDDSRPELVAVTPTKYDISQSTIYSPSL